jgi:23S rRNA (cytosine1962-C5)-methyltransferase
MQLIVEKSKDYELIDSGGGEKLERFGQYVLRRPDPQAIWEKMLPETVWQSASATYERSGASGRWIKKSRIEEQWKINIEGLSFSLSLFPSKHVGFFPEQVSQWLWLEEKIKHDTNTRIKANDTNKIRVLNLFAYTGGATIASLRAGVEVSHVDSSKLIVELAKKNVQDSKLGHKSVRFFVDDVRKFVEREIKRKAKYDIIVMDPPVYGKGSKGEAWRIESDLQPLILRLKNLMTKNPVAFVLNGYASNYTEETYANLLLSLKENFGGGVEHGRLGVRESNSKRVLTAGIFSRWKNQNDKR